MIGRFLVFEGIDGCGKSTQIKHLEEWLPESGLMPKGTSLLITREPGGTALGVALRKLLLDPLGDVSPEPLAELLLYASDRAQHVSQVIYPALNNGDWVLSDRFSGSTLAYQGYGRKLDLNIIETLEKIATRGLVPDVTIWLDLPAAESLRRRSLMINDRIESEGLDFLDEVSKGFAVISNLRNWVKIHAEKEPHDVSVDIQNALKRIVNGF